MSQIGSPLLSPARFSPSPALSRSALGRQEETKAKLDEATAMVESLQEETGEKLRAFKEETSESLGAVQVRMHLCMCVKRCTIVLQAIRHQQGIDCQQYALPGGSSVCTLT